MVEEAASLSPEETCAIFGMIVVEATEVVYCCIINQETPPTRNNDNMNYTNDNMNCETKRQSGKSSDRLDSSDGYH